MIDDNRKSENSGLQISMIPLSPKDATSLIIGKSKQLVNQLIDYRRHEKPPFLAKDYSRFVNIKEIQKANLGDTSGLLLKYQDGYVIKLNQEQPPVRQNFSCAHEIGHILFNDLKLDNFVRNIEYRRFNMLKTKEIQDRTREDLCDAVAAELLMPEMVFQKYLSNFGLSITSIEHIAYAFQVSILSATRRIAELSVEPCVATLWFPWPKSKPKCLRSSVVRHITGNFNYVPVNKSVDINSKLYKAYENDLAVKTIKQFKYGNIIKRLPIEAKGFSHGETRFVVSFAFPGRQKPTKSAVIEPQ